MKNIEGNTHFLNVLKKKRVGEISHKIDMNILRKLLSCAITVYRDCYLLQGFSNKKQVDDLLLRTDRTGVEMEENHIHVRDIISRRIIDESDMLTFGLTIVHILSAKIREHFTEGTFIIMLSMNISGRKELRDCVVRFFRKRVDEESGMPDDIEEYTSQAVARLVVHCGR